MCVGRCKRLFIVRTLVVDREVLLLPSSLRTIVPAQRSGRRESPEKEEVKLRGAEKEEVKLRGDECRERGICLEKLAPGREGGTESTEVSLRSAEGGTESASTRAISFREERAERKAGKGLHEVCLPSAG